MTGPTDEDLLRRSLAGDRGAFGQIVQRYQSLVCSIAYSASGRLAESEDLAQETFITAWQRLGDLREPGKLRAWLCGIVRNLASSASRKLRRRGGDAETIETVAGDLATPDDPGTAAIQREEEQLLWRALGEMPANYREPLILFYREQRSVAEVARQLDLTEDTVRQRLSRGRSFLRDEMTGLVESTLMRTKPGSAFAAAVLVALPMVSTTTAGAAVASGSLVATGGMAGKGLFAKLGLGVLIGPVIGLCFAFLGARAAASTARSEEERRVILRHSWRGIISFCFLMSIGLAAVLSQAGKLYTPSAAGIVIGVLAWTVALVGGILLLCRRMDREIRRVRIATNTTDEEYERALAAQGRQLKLPRYFESRMCLLGLPLFAMAWGGSNADRHRSRTVCAWVAVGDVAVSPFVAFGGVAIAPIALGAVTVGVLSLSVFWGVAVGMFALGSVAFGWWAVGCVAGGIEAAVGFAAVARDHALGIVASAAETNTPVVRDWLQNQWWPGFVDLLVHQAHWWVLAIVLLAACLRWWRGRSAEAMSSPAGGGR